MIIRFSLPNSDFKTLPDGKPYEPPPEMLKFMAWLFSLDEYDYVNARLFLAPFKFYGEAAQVSQNPLLPKLFHHMICEDYWAYRASFTPPPGSVKQ